MEKEMVVVVDESVSDSEKLIESLFHRSEVAMRPHVPLSEQRSPIPSRFQRLGDRHFVESHISTIRPFHVPLGPGVDPGSLRMASREKRGSRRTTNRVSVGLGKANPMSCDSVHVRGMKIIRSVAPRIERPLIIRIKDHHVGPFSLLIA